LTFFLGKAKKFVFSSTTKKIEEKQLKKNLGNDLGKYLFIGGKQ